MFWSSGVGASEGSRARAEARYFRAPAPGFATGVPAYLRDWDPFRMWESCLPSRGVAWAWMRMTTGARHQGWAGEEWARCFPQKGVAAVLDFFFLLGPPVALGSTRPLPKSKKKGIDQHHATSEWLWSKNHMLNASNCTASFSVHEITSGTFQHHTRHH